MFWDDLKKKLSYLETVLYNNSDFWFGLHDAEEKGMLGFNFVYWLYPENDYTTGPRHFLLGPLLFIGNIFYNKFKFNSLSYKSKTLLFFSGNWLWTDGQSIDNSMDLPGIHVKLLYHNEEGAFCAKMEVGLVGLRHTLSQAKCSEKHNYICERGLSHLKKIKKS